MLKRFWHALIGHPIEQVVWGGFTEGATCECGAKWELADYY